MSDASNTVNSADPDTAVAEDTSGVSQTQTPVPTTPLRSGHTANATPKAQSAPTLTEGEKQADGPYDEFLTRADKQIAREQKHLGDPVLENTNTLQKSFAGLSFFPSIEAISSIVEDSPLNKTIAPFKDETGDVARDFVTKLQSLPGDKSKGELAIERYLEKSEETFFPKVKKDNTK